MRMVQVAHAIGAAATAACPSVAYSHNTAIEVWAGPSEAPAMSARNSLAPVKSRTKAVISPATITLRQRFAALRVLDDGWDGANSLAPDKKLMNLAARVLATVLQPLELIDAPNIVPVADGGIQAEWHIPKHRFEMYFDADGEISSWSNNLETGVEIEEDGPDAIRLLVDWVTAREDDRLTAA